MVPAPERRAVPRAWLNQKACVRMWRGFGNIGRRCRANTQELRFVPTDLYAKIICIAVLFLFVDSVTSGQLPECRVLRIAKAGGGAKRALPRGALRSVRVPNLFLPFPRFSLWWLCICPWIDGQCAGTD